MSYFTLAIIGCILATVYFYIKSLQSFWSRNGIPAAEPTFLLGNLWDTIVGRRNFGVIVADLYKEYNKYRYLGFYKFLTSTLIIRDPEIIGNIMVKDFQHFSNNDVSADENVDYIMAKNLFVMKGHQWRYTKSLLTPMFTSGKLKHIFPMLENVSQQMVQYLKREGGQCVDGKDLCTKFTTNNVASAAFGLDGKAFEEDTEFVKCVQDFGNPSYLNSIKIMLVFIFPPAQKFLKLKFFSDAVEEYLTGVVSETMRYRKENNIVRNDFLDQINQLKEKSTEFPFTDRDVVAQGAGFFIDGVETSAGVMAYVLYDIATHPEVQERIREDIQRELSKKPTLTYEALSSMTYLDWVVSESLRMHPPGMVLLKTCTEEYTLPEICEGDNTCWTVKPGDSVILPVLGLQSDPQYYPDPEKFIPERFSDDNKASIPKHTYIPFGNGPRGCLGIRFGVLQIKVGIVALLNNFEVAVNKKMLPVEIHPNALLQAPKKGFSFDFKPLDK